MLHFISAVPFVMGEKKREKTGLTVNGMLIGLASVCQIPNSLTWPRWLLQNHKSRMTVERAGAEMSFMLLTAAEM